MTIIISFVHHGVWKGNFEDLLITKFLGKRNQFLSFESAINIAKESDDFPPECQAIKLHLESKF